MKTLFNILAAIGFAVVLWSVGENDHSVFTDTQTFWIGLAGLGTFGIGLFLARVREALEEKR